MGLGTAWPRRCALACGWLAVVGVTTEAAAEAVAHPEAQEFRSSGGAFVGGNYLGSQLGLGGALPSDQVPGSAALVGARLSYLVVPELLLGSDARPRLHAEVEMKLATASMRGDADAGRGSYFAPVTGWRAQGRLELWPQRALSPFAVAGLGGETLVTRSPSAQSPDTSPALIWGLGAELELNPRAGVRADVRQGLTSARSRRLTATYEAHAGFFVRFGQAPAQPDRRIYVEGPQPGAPAVAAAGAECGETAGECPLGVRFDEPATGAADPLARNGETIRGAAARSPNGGPPSRAAARAVESDASAPGEEESEGEPARVLDRLAELADQVRFEAGSADLRPSSRPVIDEIAEHLAENPSLRVEVGGHTDSHGQRSLNVMLSHARARQVVRNLIDRGIDSDRLEAAGYGPDRPIETNDTAAGRAANRRIEIRSIDGTID